MARITNKELSTYATTIQKEARKLKDKDPKLQHRDAVRIASAALKKSGFFKKKN